MHSTPTTDDSDEAKTEFDRAVAYIRSGKCVLSDAAVQILLIK